MNGTLVGGKKRNFYHDDMWTIKYLRGFKWRHLTEKLGAFLACFVLGGGVGMRVCESRGACSSVCLPPNQPTRIPHTNPTTHPTPPRTNQPASHTIQPPTHSNPAYERRVREQKLRVEMMQAKKENALFAQLVEKKKVGVLVGFIIPCVWVCV